MVRGCALIDYRLDTAKICSDKRVHVDHAELPAVFGGEKTFSHGLGQNRKSSSRAYVFRFAPKNGHRATSAACPFRADSVAKVPKAAAAKFSPKNKTSDNRRAHASQNLRPMPQKNFCNTICHEQT